MLADFCVGISTVQTDVHSSPCPALSCAFVRARRQSGSLPPMTQNEHGPSTFTDACTHEIAMSRAISIRPAAETSIGPSADHHTVRQCYCIHAQ